MHIAYERSNKNQQGYIRQDNCGLLYDPAYVTKVKTIEGYRWHPKEKHWSFPYSDGILEKILKVFDGKK